MNTMLKKMAVALGLGLILIGTILTAKASAECLSYLPGHKGAVVSPQSWRGAEFGSASLLLVSYQASNDPIVGFWKVTFTAEGNTEGPPDDTPIDSGYVQWHSDGTEIMNSGRPPQNGDFCLGVWEKNRKIQIQAQSLCLMGTLSIPPTRPQIGPPGGPTQITEDIILSRDGNHYAGTFTLDAYDTPANGNILLRGPHHRCNHRNTHHRTHPSDQRVLGKRRTRKTRNVLRVVGRKACHSARTKKVCIYLTYP